MSDQVKTSPARENAKCTIEGCKRPYRAKGYCVTHYSLWRQGSLEGHKARYKICTKEGCKKPRLGSGLCEEHSKKSEASA